MRRKIQHYTLDVCFKLRMFTTKHCWLNLKTTHIITIACKLI